MPTLLETYRQKYLGAQPVEGVSSNGLLPSLRERYLAPTLAKQPATPAEDTSRFMQIGGGQNTVSGEGSQVSPPPSKLDELRAAKNEQKFTGQPLVDTIYAGVAKYGDISRSTIQDYMLDKATAAEMSALKAAAQDPKLAEALVAKAPGPEAARRTEWILRDLRSDRGYAGSDRFREDVTSQMGLAGNKYPPGFKPTIVSDEAAQRIVDIAIQEAKKVGAPPEQDGWFGQLQQMLGGVVVFAGETALFKRAGMGSASAMGTASGVGALAAGQDPQAGFVQGATLGGAMGRAGQLAGGGMRGVGAQSATAGGVTYAQTGDVKSAIEMMILPAILEAPGLVRTRVARRAEAAIVAKHELALEAARRTLPSGEKEPIMDTAERIASMANPPRKALPTVDRLEDRVQISSDLKMVAESQKRIAERTAEIKKIANKKKRERALNDDPVIAEELQKINNLLTVNEYAKTEFMEDMGETMKVQVGNRTMREYANRMGKQKPPTVSSEQFTQNLELRRKLERGETDVFADLHQGEGVERTATKPETPRSAEYTPAVETLPREAGRLGPQGQGLIAVTALSEAPRKIKNAAMRWLVNGGEFDVVPGGAGSVIPRLAERRQAFINEQAKAAQFAGDDLKKAIQKSFGKAVTELQLEHINAVLRGKRAASTLPPSIRQEASKMRNHIDALSREMIAAGVVEGELAALIDQNAGVYMNRSHQVFDDPKWGEKVSPLIKNRFISFLRSEFPSDPPNLLQARMNELLFIGAAERPTSFIDAVRSGKLGQKNLGILKESKNIAQELRALWGEYTDPVVNYTKTIHKMSALIASHKMLQGVRDAGLGKFLWTENDPKRPAEAAATIARGDHRMLPLAGLRTFPEIRAAIDSYYTPQPRPTWLRRVLQVASTAKLGKTALSPQSTVRNYVANYGILTRNGTLFSKQFPARMGKAVMVGAYDAEIPVAKQLAERWGTVANLRADVLRYRKLGISSMGGSSGELKALMDDVANGGWDAPYKSKGLPTKALKLALEAYRVGDDIPKIVEFEDKLAAYRKAKPAMPQSQLEEYVANMVGDTMPTYARVPKAIEAIRSFPFIGPFPSFFWEMGRTTYHNTRYMMKELADPELRHIGAKRLAGTLTALSLPTAASAYSRMSLGISRDDENDLRLFMAPWDENAEVFFWGGDRKHGTWQYINLSYTDPMQQFKEAFTATMRGDSIDEAFTKATLAYLQPFVGEELLATVAFDLARNSDRNGNPIYNPQSDPVDRIRVVLERLGKTMEPGVVSSLRKEWMAQTGQKGYYGDAPKKWVNLAGMVTGIKVQNLDVRQSLKFKAREYMKAMDDSRYLMTRVAGNRGAVSGGEIADAYEKMEAARRRNFDKIVKVAKAAQNLGVGEVDVLRILRDGGVSKRESSAIAYNIYHPYDPTDFLKGEEGMDERRLLLNDLYLRHQEQASAQ